MVCYTTEWFFVSLNVEWLWSENPVVTAQLLNCPYCSISMLQQSLWSISPSLVGTATIQDGKNSRKCLNWEETRCMEFKSSSLHCISCHTVQVVNRSWYSIVLHSYRLHLVFFKMFVGHKSFVWDHWYPCFGLVVMSPIGFKARVGSLIFAWERHLSYTFIEIYLWCDTRHLLVVSKLYLQAGIGGAQNWDLSCCYSQFETIFVRNRYYCNMILHTVFMFVDLKTGCKTIHTTWEGKILEYQHCFWSLYMSNPVTKGGRWIIVSFTAGTRVLDL